MSKILRFAKDESGATAIEYGLLAVGIGVFIITGIALAGNALNTLFAAIATALAP